MLTKKHVRPQVSSKLTMTMGEKINHMKSEHQGGGTIPPSTTVPPHRRDVSQAEAPGGQCWPHLPSHSLPAWEDFPSMPQLGNGQH